jgi:transcriptional regulator GlxA family with amidase domain
MKAKNHLKVAILVFEDCAAMSPVCAMEILGKAGAIHQELWGNPKPFFETELVGVKTKKVKSSEKFTVECHTTLAKMERPDILLIPAIEFDVEEKLKRNKAVIPILLEMHKKGTELGAMCTGSFLLAATGLLNNKSATTHWYMAPAFRVMFPNVVLEDHKVIVDENGLYSSGGATSSLNLCLYLAEKYCGKETANQATRMLLMDTKNATQTQYTMFIPQTQHNDEAIYTAQKTIEEGFDERITVEGLALKVHLSKRNFIRRFKAATGNTPIEYMQRMNVEKAKRRLESSNSSVEEIIYSLGYNDINSFRKIFTRYTDLTPKEYRRKYGA